MSTDRRISERTLHCASGWLALFLVVVLFVAAITLFVSGVTVRPGNPPRILGGIVLLVVATILSSGFFVNAPNEARVLVLFGSYRGTERRNGFFWTNPFATKRKLSLRMRTLNGERLKVNDRMGNPIEIAAIVVWQVRDSAQASFDVEDYAQYVALQSETAVRHLTSAYPYDASEHELSLRGATDEVNGHLQREVQERLAPAGVEVIEARFSHLAYAPEIAHAMLQRQQATAVVAARSKIVEGAVGMVEMALDALSEKHIVNLDEERKASMVSNLLVVLCSDRAAQPVVNTGTLYQ